MNWNSVTPLLESEPLLKLGPQTSNYFLFHPEEWLTSLTHYKFATKLIGKGKRVVDIGCHEGWGSWLIAKELGACIGMDRDSKALEWARHTFSHPGLTFLPLKYASLASGNWDALVLFDLFETLPPSSFEELFHDIINALSKRASALISRRCLQTSDEKTQAGRFLALLSASFETLFFFSSHGEVIQAGIQPHASHQLALCLSPKGEKRG